jgi:hypothetical protein
MTNDAREAAAIAVSEPVTAKVVRSTTTRRRGPRGAVVCLSSYHMRASDRRLTKPDFEPERTTQFGRSVLAPSKRALSIASRSSIAAATLHLR